MNMVEPIAYIRRLTVLLVISGSLNIILVALFFYWNIRERPPTPYFELKPAEIHEQQGSLAADHSDSEVIRYFRRMPLEWLVSRLTNTQLVENGYTQRDLALASLVTFHYFDLDRALAGLSKPQQKRSILYGKFRDGTPAELTVYPGLSDKHFEAIVNFAATERWPMTAKGLFMALQKEDKGPRDPSLVDVFMMTPEFSLVDMLFSRNVVPVDKDELLTMVLEGGWTQLAGFVQHQKTVQDLSPAKRQALLLDYVQHKVKSAAYLMIKTDGAFATRKLDDNQVVGMLQLMDVKTPEAEQFALSMMTSPRSDAVWKAAATRLYTYAGEVPPADKDIHAAALARFAPGHTFVAAAAPPPTLPPAQKMPSPKPAPPPLPAPPPAPQKMKIQLPKPSAPVASQRKIMTARQDRFYVVQEGDSLWKISRRFNVDMEVIRAYNQLDTDNLRPGRTLKIP